MRRALARLQPWLIALLVFTPLTALIISVAVRNGAVDGKTVIPELIFLFLGSVVLLIVKEEIDEEQKRKVLLERQYAFYALLLADFKRGVCTVFEELGMPCGESRILDSRENLDAALHLLKTQPAAIGNQETLLAATASLQEALRDARSTLLGGQFVDFVFTDQFGWNFSGADYELDQLRAAIRRKDAGQATKELAPLIRNLFFICQALNKPWQGENSEAHHRALADYVARYGIPVASN